MNEISIRKLSEQLSADSDNHYEVRYYETSTKSGKNALVERYYLSFRGFYFNVLVQGRHVLNTQSKRELFSCLKSL